MSAWRFATLRLRSATRKVSSLWSRVRPRSVLPKTETRTLAKGPQLIPFEDVFPDRSGIEVVRPLKPQPGAVSIFFLYQRLTHHKRRFGARLVGQPLGRVGLLPELFSLRAPGVVVGELQVVGEFVHLARHLAEIDRRIARRDRRVADGPDGISRRLGSQSRSAGQFRCRLARRAEGIGRVH